MFKTKFHITVWERNVLFSYRPGRTRKTTISLTCSYHMLSVRVSILWPLDQTVHVEYVTTYALYVYSTCRFFFLLLLFYISLLRFVLMFAITLQHVQFGWRKLFENCCTNITRPYYNIYNIYVIRT